jgi:hypothetical protein
MQAGAAAHAIVQYPSHALFPAFGGCIPQLQKRYGRSSSSKSKAQGAVVTGLKRGSARRRTRRGAAHGAVGAGAGEPGAGSSSSER